MVELRWHEISKHENVKESQIFTSDLENIAIKQELDQSMDFQNLSKTPEISNENSLISIRNKPLPELESKSRGDLNRHTLSIHEKQKPFDKHGVQKRHLFPCNYCGAIRTSKQKLYIHLIGVREGKKEFRCDINDCEYASNSKDDLERHSLVNHEKTKQKIIQ